MENPENFCIIGSGIAGMSLAIRFAEKIESSKFLVNKKIILITQSELVSGSTPLAQGGIAAVFRKKDDSRVFSDSFESHYKDTMKAGHFVNNPEVVKILVESAPHVMQDLKKWGINFNMDRHLEGGHSHHRIFNTSDSTGKTIAEGLEKKVREFEKLGKIEVLAYTELVDFESLSPITLTLKNTNTQEIFTKKTQKLFLATGGYASQFSSFTTPPEATGSAIKIFENHGGITKNMDWVQFHPTALDIECIPRFLISEAVRGAGAKIVNKTGKEICDPLLARDIISDKIKKAEKINLLSETKNQIYLDCKKIPNFDYQFPIIYSKLIDDFNLDASSDLIPITPAAHYCMGGIETDIWGRTSMKNIFALGECAYTGVHGKNRLASNSLLEGMVFSKQIIDFLLKNGYNPMKN